jgi:predicted secreted protein
MMIHGNLHHTTMEALEAAVPGDAASSDIDLKLSVGETRELILASLGTAGFVWSYGLEDNDGILRLTRRRGDPEKADPVGRSTTERLLITATAPGRARIRMHQARPWESGVAPRASLAINVEVSN